MSVPVDRHFISAKLHELFAARISGGAAPGSVAAVFGADGELICSAGFGGDRVDASAATPDADTAFRIASCTKSFTAAAALLLRDRGALVLDQQITDFVPEFRFTTGADAPTLRQLLSMSGGLSTDDPWADRQESLSDAGFRALLRAGTPADSIPGTRFRYSNLGYALLGQAIAQAAGMPFRDFVSAELIEPLGLRATGFLAEGRPGRTAIGHRRGADGAWHPLPFTGPGAFSPIGGLVTTARELARWGAWLASALSDAAQPGPLSAASRRELQQVHRTFASTREGVHENGYGFGLMVEKGEAFGHTVSHSGGYPGFSAHLRWNAPSGLGVVAFENATYARVSEPATELMDALIAQGGSAAGNPAIGNPAPWPETIALARAADRLIDAWIADSPAGDLEAQLLSPNVAADTPLAERRTELRRLGVLPLSGHSELEASPSPAAVSWSREAQAGPVRVVMSLAPVLPARIQSLAISPESAME